MQATQNTTGGQKSIVIIRLCDAQAQTNCEQLSRSRQVQLQSREKTRRGLNGIRLRQVRGNR